MSDDQTQDTTEQPLSYPVRYQYSHEWKDWMGTVEFTNVRDLRGANWLLAPQFVVEESETIDGVRVFTKIRLMGFGVIPDHRLRQIDSADKAEIIWKHDERE